MFYICNCIIVILYIPRHVVRVNKSYLILSPTCYAKTRLASYSIRFLASQHFNTDNSLHQCRAFILFLDVRTMRTFVYQFGIALRDA